MSTVNPSPTLKPSNQPPLWLLFGAGGMLSALIGAVLVFVTGIAAPLDWFAANPMSYGNMIAFARNPLGALFIFAVISLFLWHAAHRIYHTLHDLGIHGNVFLWLACYGVALAATITSAVALLRI
jgi:fumarate reductase subunit D